MAEFTSTPIIGANVETGRLGGSVRQGSFASYRKSATMDARASMQDIVRKYQQVLRHMHGVTPEILRQVMQPVFAKTQKYVPVDTSNLKSTGRLTIGVTRGRPSAVISYGGPGARYAAIVHERLDVRHKSPTRAKYISSAMEEEFPGVLVHLAFLYSTELRHA